MALNDAVPSSATDVFKRNAEDTDRLLNQTANVVNRVGTTLETFPSSTGRVSTAADAAQVAIQADVDAAEAAKVAALSSYAQWNSRGDWVTATAYAKGDIWNNTVTNTWYLVLNAYTSGATVNDDIAGPNVTVLQGAKYGTFEGLSDAVAFVTAHPELFPDNTAVSTLSYRTSAECLTLGIAYPDGGSASLLVEDNDGSGLSDGVWSAGAKQLRLVDSSEVKLLSFGVVANGVFDDTNAIASALKYSSGKRLIAQDGIAGVSRPIQVSTNVTFIGSSPYHDNSGQVLRGSWFKILETNSFTKGQAVFNIISPSFYASRTYTNFSKIGIHGNRDIVANGTGIRATARNIVVEDCVIIRMANDGILSADDYVAPAGCNSSVFANNWVGFNGGTGLRMTRTSYSGDNVVRGGHYHWNDEAGVDVNQPNTTLDCVYSWWNRDGFVIRDGLSGLTDMADCRGYDNARAGVYLEGDVNYVSVSGDYHANGNDARATTLSDAPTFTSDEKAGIYCDGACSSITFGQLQFGYLSSSTKQAKGISFTDAAASATVGTYAAGGDIGSSISVVTPSLIQNHGNISGMGHPGFVATGDIDVNGNDLLSSRLVSYDAWFAGNITSSTITVTSSTAAVASTGAVSITDLVADFEGLPLVIIRNAGTSPITFVNDFSKLRNNGKTDIILTQGESIGYIQISAGVWQNIMGKK